MPANILNLPQYRILRVEETGYDLHVTAEPTADTSSCPHCHCAHLTSWGTRKQVFKDLPRHDKRVSIHIDTRRFRCQACGKTFSQSLPMLAENRMMTDRLARWIGQQALKRTFVGIAEETGLVEGTIRNVFRDYVAALEQSAGYETPVWMGISEIHMINRPRSVITDMQNNAIVEMLHNLNGDTVEKHLSGMSHRDNVRYVTMDMWAPYRDAVEGALPGAVIVIDKILLVRMANEAMEKARKRVRVDPSLKQKRGLMSDRIVTRKRDRDLDDEERHSLEAWSKIYPVLGEAYRLKEGFCAIYEEAGTPEDALLRYEAWSRGLPPEVRPYFDDLLQAFQGWQPYILNYFGHPVTSPCIESLSILSRVLSRQSRGFSFEALRAMVLFSQAGEPEPRQQNFGADIGALIRMLGADEL